MATYNTIPENSSSAPFGDSTVQNPNNHSTVPRTTDSGILGSDVGHNTTTEHRRIDPSYTHGSSRLTSSSTPGTTEEHSPYTATSIDTRVHNNNGPGTHTSTSTTGPHSSNLANKVDPRVDSGHERSVGATRTHAPGSTGGESGLLASTNETWRPEHGNVASMAATGQSSSVNAGPHDSMLANKFDPRVDSDREGSRVAGVPGTATSGSSTAGTHALGTDHSNSINAGPHESNFANRVDPRVDSERDGLRVSGVPGAATYGSATTDTSLYGANHPASTNGPYDSNLANREDPRVEYGRDGSRVAGSTGAATYGSSNTSTNPLGATHPSTNASPHDSNLLNKTDPRIDSDRSQTTGTTTTTPAHELNPTLNPMTGSHSHHGTGRFHVTQDTHDALHQRDHIDGADHTRGLEERRGSVMDGKGTPGGMPEIVKQGLRELKGGR